MFITGCPAKVWTIVFKVRSTYSKFVLTDFRSKTVLWKSLYLFYFYVTPLIFIVLVICSIYVISQKNVRNSYVVPTELKLVKFCFYLIVKLCLFLFLTGCIKTTWNINIYLHLYFLKYMSIFLNVIERSNLRCVCTWKTTLNWNR